MPGIKQVQFNDGGSFGGNSAFTFDAGNAKVNITGYNLKTGANYNIDEANNIFVSIMIFNLIIQIILLIFDVFSLFIHHFRS